MSYKFTLDHTLAIETIHDMITIDIRPETRCSVTGNDVEIHGYLAFDGSYLTDELGEERFEGMIPLDITLPYLGGAPDVHPEIVSFDYLVKAGESLTLNLEISLKGYEVGTKTLDVRADAMDAWIEPVTDGPVIEEARIEPFDITLPTEQSVAASVEAGTLTKEEATFDKEQCCDEEVNLHVVAKIESVVEAEAIFDREQCVDEDKTEEVESSVVAEAESVVEEEAAFDREPCADEEKAEEVASPVVGEAESIVEEAIPYSPLVEIETRDIEIEEIEFDSPMGEELPVEIVAEGGRTPKMTNSAAALMKELFEMKRGTAFREQEDVLEVVDPIAPTEEVDEKNDDVEEVEPIVIVDSVARQFADRASTIKMVYVRHESETLGALLTRYSVTMDDVWNLSELADGIDIGDCVMIKYEKPI